MELKIVNHIKIDGQEYLFEELSEERKKDIACLIQENAMKAVGYCKVAEKGGSRVRYKCGRWWDRQDQGAVPGNAPQKKER